MRIVRPAEAISWPCPQCGAVPGVECITRPRTGGEGRKRAPHADRVYLAIPRRERR